MYCPNCGTELPDDASFCQECGNNLDGENSNAAAQNAGAVSQQSEKQKESLKDIMLPGKDENLKTNWPLRIFVSAFFFMIALMVFALT